MSTVIAIAVVVCSLGMLVAYQLGFSAGHREGFSEGHDKGRQSGETEGLKIGYDRGKHDRQSVEASKKPSSPRFGCVSILLLFVFSVPLSCRITKLIVDAIPQNAKSNPNWTAPL